ncbi:hypothetical protein BJ742DRAFT_859152 [Cladochytrium replicatum]|nr:hypothetical protein BJ742DRAFT_859152 [Cladochytrium replicatum]
MLVQLALTAALISVVAGQPGSDPSIAQYECSLDRLGYYTAQATQDGGDQWIYLPCPDLTVCFPDYAWPLTPCRRRNENTCPPEYADTQICGGLNTTNSILECVASATPGTKVWETRNCGTGRALCGSPGTPTYGTALCSGEGPLFGAIFAASGSPFEEDFEIYGVLSFEQGFNTSFRLLPREQIDKVLFVEFPLTEGLFSILGTNTKANKVNLYVGAVATGEDAEFTLSPETDAFAIITGTQKTEPGARPEFGRNSYTALKGESRAVESEIWSWNPETLELTAHWTNPEGGEPFVPTIVLNLHHPYTYFPRVFLTGNAELFAATMGGRTTVTKLFFVPVVLDGGPTSGGSSANSVHTSIGALAAQLKASFKK